MTSHSHLSNYVKEIRLYQVSETGIVWLSDNKKADATNISLFYSLSVALAILSKRNLLTGEGDFLSPASAIYNQKEHSINDSERQFCDWFSSPFC